MDLGILSFIGDLVILTFFDNLGLLDFYGTLGILNVSRYPLSGSFESCISLYHHMVYFRAIF